MQMSAENVAHILKPLCTLCTKDQNNIGIYRCSLNISDLMANWGLGFFFVFLPIWSSSPLNTIYKM